MFDMAYVQYISLILALPWSYVNRPTKVRDSLSPGLRELKPSGHPSAPWTATPSTTFGTGPIRKATENCNGLPDPFYSARAAFFL